MTTSLPIPTPPTPGLTPNTRTEAEAALSYNALIQTVSAAPASSDQTTRPPFIPRTNSSNYQSAAASAHLSPEPPYPSDETAEAVRGNLSRGTTQAVLAKMHRIVSNEGAGEDEAEETLLSKRTSREGARRTSEVAADGGAAKAMRPGVFQRQSYNKEDLKRLMSEKLMEDGAAEASGAGYESVR